MKLNGLLAVSVVFPLSCAANAAVYDWQADWNNSGVQPNGTWSYLGASYNATNPVDYNTSVTWVAPSTPGENGYWFIGDQGWGYSIWKGTTGGWGNQWRIIAWTAPESGIATLSAVGYATTGWSQGSLQVEIRDKSGNLIDSVITESSWDDQAFSLIVNNFTVDAGDTIYFRTKTPASNEYKNAVFSDLSVTLTSVPEVASVGLLIMGGLAGLMRRKH